MPYQFRNLMPPYVQDATNTYVYNNFEKITDYYRGERQCRQYGTWAQYGTFFYAEAGTYTYSVFVKSATAQRIALTLIIDNNMLNQYATTEVKNNMAVVAEPTNTEIVTTSDFEWIRYSFTFTVTTAGYIMPRCQCLENLTYYLYSCCHQVEVGTTATLYEGYHNTWYIDNGELTHTSFPEVPDKPFRLPLPKSVWRIREHYNNTFPYNALMNDIGDVGAFANATNLQRVVIPQTVGYIGTEAFKNSQLTSVTIAQNCTYYDTSFPEDCTINHYP